MARIKKYLYEKSNPNVPQAILHLNTEKTVIRSATVESLPHATRVQFIINSQLVSKTFIIDFPEHFFAMYNSSGDKKPLIYQTLSKSTADTEKCDCFK